MSSLVTVARSGDDGAAAEPGEVARRHRSEIDVAGRDVAHLEGAVRPGLAVGRGDDVADEQQITQTARNRSDVSARERLGRIGTPRSQTRGP